jgi:hypothetical protein
VCTPPAPQAQPQQQQQRRRRLHQTLNSARFSLVRSRAPPERPASTAHTTINVNSAGTPIPESFLGISHEWDNIEELATTSEYVTLLKDLSAYGTGPLILRVGGSSSDKQTAVSSQTVWDAFKKMNADTGEGEKRVCGGGVLLDAATVLAPSAFPICCPCSLPAAPLSSLTHVCRPPVCHSGVLCHPRDALHPGPELPVG